MFASYLTRSFDEYYLFHLDHRIGSETNITIVGINLDKFLTVTLEYQSL